MKPSKESLDAGYRKLCVNIPSCRCPTFREFESAVLKMYELDSTMVDLEITQLRESNRTKRNKVMWWAEEYGKLLDKCHSLESDVKFLGVTYCENGDMDIDMKQYNEVRETIATRKNRELEYENKSLREQIKELQTPKSNPKREKKQYRRELRRVAECKEQDQCSCKWGTAKRDGTEEIVAKIQLHGHYDYYKTGPTYEYEVKRCKTCGGQFVSPEIAWA